MNFWPKWLTSYLTRQSLTWPATPSIRWGYIRAPFVRWEQAGAAEGSDKFTDHANRLLHNLTSAGAGLPADYGITHLQKQSRFGFLIPRPFCFYVWWQIRPQKTQLGDGNVLIYVPGSELCPTFRAGKARWDAFQKKYIVPTLQAALHWD